MSSDPSSELAPGRDVATGSLILGALLLSLAFACAHPVVRSHRDRDLVAQIQAISVSNRVVHGALIVLVGVLFTGYSGVAARLDLNSVLVRAGLIGCAIGTVGWIAAALLDGFILPAFIDRYAGRPASDLDTMRQILALGREANQASSRLAVVAMSVGLICWSWPLARKGLVSTAVLGAGLSVGLIAGLLTDHLAMNLHGVLIFLLAQTLWGVPVAVSLIRGRL